MWKSVWDCKIGACVRVSVCNVLRARKEVRERKRELKMKSWYERDEQPTAIQTQIDRYVGEHLQFESKKGGNKVNSWGEGGDLTPKERK